MRSVPGKEKDIPFNRHVLLESSSWKPFYPLPAPNHQPPTRPHIPIRSLERENFQLLFYTFLLVIE